MMRSGLSRLGRFIQPALFGLSGFFAHNGKRLVIAVPYLWLIIFFLLPCLIIFKISLAQPVVSQPPYTPLLSVDDTGLSLGASLANYIFLLGDSLYISAYLNSLKVAALSTLLCLLLGYPLAYAIARSPHTIRPLLLLLVILPFWTSFLIRVYAWIGILQNNGLLNNFLLSLGLIDAPIQILYTPVAVYIGIVYSYLPFMVLPLYATLEKMDINLLEAASDLGCRPWRSFCSITLPLSLSGILAGCLLVFIPAVGEFVIPDLLGGPDSPMIGRVLWQEFFNNRDWPMASTIAIAMLLLLVAPMIVLQRLQNKIGRS